MENTIEQIKSLVNELNLQNTPLLEKPSEYELKYLSTDISKGKFIKSRFPEYSDPTYWRYPNGIEEKIEDKKLAELGLSAKDQVKLFIALAQLAGHPVIYDVLPQTGRFSKVVLANPYVARWFDIEQLMNQIIGFLEAICQNMNSKKGRKPYKKEDVEKAKTAYIENLKGSKKKYSKLNAEIIEKFEEELKEFKIFSS